MVEQSAVNRLVVGSSPTFGVLNNRYKFLNFKQTNAILEKGLAFVFHLNGDVVAVSFSSMYEDSGVLIRPSQEQCSVADMYYRRLPYKRKTYIVTPPVNLATIFTE